MALAGDWDGLVRGISLCASILIGVLFWWPRTSRLLALCGSALALSTIAFNLLGFAPLAGIEIVRRVCVVMALTAPFWFWAVIVLLFEDRPRLPRLSWLVPAFLVAASLSLQLLPRDHVWRGPLALDVRVIGVVLMLHAGWIVLKGRKHDLVAGRLQLRGWLFAALICGVACFVALRLSAPLLIDAKPLPLVQSAIIAAFQLTACVLLFSPNRSLFPAPQQKALPLLPDARRLVAFMEEEQPWKDPELTVSGLAQRLAIPEYKLRKLINQTLGYRNFPAFLNSYRLQAAAERLLAEPKLPILSVALDHGFGSIGPFNRAFKDRFGTTPSAYRRGH